MERGTARLHSATGCGQYTRGAQMQAWGMGEGSPAEARTTEFAGVGRAHREADGDAVCAAEGLDSCFDAGPTSMEERRAP